MVLTFFINFLLFHHSQSFEFRLRGKMSANVAAYAVGAVAAVAVPTYFLVNNWAQGGVFRDNDARIDGKIVIITGSLQHHDISVLAFNE